MKDDLKIVNSLKKTIIYLDKIVVNFPNNERKLKDNIMGTLYEVLELIYFSNELSPKDRIIYQKKIISKIKMLDFYFKICMDKKYISYKKYIKIGTYLVDLLKGIYGWIKYEKI